jgi:hypothetical protein
MKLMKSFLVIILFIICMPLAGQAPSFEEMEFEPDSVKAAYKPAGKNYVFIRSKRGTSGINKTPAADAILSAEVTEIVLVFSELDPSAIADREEANRERWENLLKTYPELFQFSTTYKNLCQCNNHGDSATFKKAQGFYVYVNGEVPKVEEPKAVASPPPVAKTEKIEEKPSAAKPTKVAENPPAAKQEKAAVKEEPVAANKTPEKTKEVPVVEKQVKETAKVDEAPVVSEVQEEAAAPAVKENPRKASGAVKSRRAKDPKACRPPCYESGDDDLNAFFKTSITLSKKQKRHGKNLVSVVKLQLNVDGSIKKALVTGEDEVLNQQVTSAANMMNRWNPAVKGGVTVKSEVKITLKYDKETKGMKPFEIMVTPRPAPKCKCMSDAEIFGSD